MNFVAHTTSLARYLERQGYTVDSTRGSTSVSASDNARIAALPPAERYPLWLVESLLTGLRACLDGDRLLALRCALQTYEYRGAAGAWPDPLVHDAALALRGALEDDIRVAGVRSAASRRKDRS